MTKNQRVRRIIKGLASGLCLCYGGMVFAGSATVSGTTGTNPTYIVVPDEYAGKEGQFVATASSSNTTSVSYGSPYKEGDWACITRTTRSYGALSYSLTTPSGTSYQGGSVTLNSLERGSYTVNVEQSRLSSTVYYKLNKSYWADTEVQTFSDLSYYVQHNTLPAGAGVSGTPMSTNVNSSSSSVTANISVASAYIVVYGVDDTPAEPPSSGNENTSGSTNITITTGTDAGVYTLISSLFGYIYDMQSILSSSNNQIRSELLSYIMELQSAYQIADTQLAATIQNQINALVEAVSMDVAGLRAALEAQIAEIAANSEEADVAIISDYSARLAELANQLEALTSIGEQNMDELIDKINVLANAVSMDVAGLRAALEAQIAEIAANSEEADSAIISDYSTRLAELANQLEALTSIDEQNMDELIDKINVLANAVSMDMAGLRAALEAQITEIAANSEDADAAIISDYSAKLAELANQLEALTSIGEQNMDELIDKINAGDAENAAALQNMELVLKLYCDSLKDALGNRIAILEETISALQRALQQRMQTLEDRLTYSLMTDEELTALEESQKTVASALAQHIAGLNVTIGQYKTDNKDFSELEEQLNSLVAEYYTVCNNLENVRYVIELRSSSELALHRKWIKELQELTISLQLMVDAQSETIALQVDRIAELNTMIANLEQALRNEQEMLKRELTEYIDGNVNVIHNEIVDIVEQVKTLRDNITTLATGSYSSGNSSSGGGHIYDYSGTSEASIKDDRDLRTSSETALDF
ncbi:MAG: hypothetical protein JXR78_16685 [Victivallales bacterium]|nr:hypothetical protein [Victivallales bacterium]